MTISIAKNNARDASEKRNHCDVCDILDCQNLSRERGAARNAQHAGVAAIGAAISGGDVGAAVGGSLTGDMLQSVARTIIDQSVAQLPLDQQRVVPSIFGAMGGSATSEVTNNAIGRSLIFLSRKMKARMRRNARALFAYILICLLTLMILALCTEFLLIPLILWMNSYPEYYLPDLARMYAWCKLIAFAAVVGGVGAWLHDRKRFG